MVPSPMLTSTCTAAPNNILPAGSTKKPTPFFEIMICAVTVILTQYMQKSKDIRHNSMCFVQFSLFCAILSFVFQLEEKAKLW